MFVRFGCGCIGIPVDGPRQIVIQACDGDADLTWTRREIKPENLPGVPVEDEVWHTRLAQGMGRGENWRQLQFLLGLPREGS